ncbi:MAG TPA: hypothetical protein H9841_01610 [Candidatus Flavonifractor merdigallinarum]|uniref:Uncharacterized protein n=1 Tax=Candidatus Flavonifractor merdigallinarum TaxID=2838589 RepID=A0A9D2BXX2_9FIRM|nr:hypothetical protein [Candidatus Flavonifractor merdigallinarum]
MLDLAGRERKEKANRKRIFKLIEQIPEGIPNGWESRTLAVGGLMYVGFSELHPEQLICISSQGQSLIDCTTGKKRYVEEWFDEDNLTAYTDGPESEEVHIAGIEGGGLRHFSKEGNGLEQIAPIWPTEQVIFMPSGCSWWNAPKDCHIVFDGYEIRAYGFNKSGDFFLIATSSELILFQKRQ